MSSDKKPWCTHGFTRDRKNKKEYMVWKNMKQRCLNPKNKGFQRYGGRGIKVCDRWMDFKSFISDMGLAPTTTHSIERIDNDGNYEPSNCRWATNDEQNRNKSSNVYISYGGATKIRNDWAKEYGIDVRTFRYRLETLKWPFEKAISTKASRSHVLTESDVKQIRKLLKDGLSHRKIAKIFSCGASTVHAIRHRVSWQDVD